MIAPPEVYPIPQTPSYFVGIMNLRVQVITCSIFVPSLALSP